MLLASGQIRIRRAALLEGVPDTSPRAWDRVEGMLLGLAIGDALGNTTEGQFPGARRAAHGETRDYLPNYKAQDRRVGLPSDDTQLAFWTLEQALEDRHYEPEALARKFASGRIFGIGSTVSEFLHRFKDQGVPWFEAGPFTVGHLSRGSGTPSPSVSTAGHPWSSAMPFTVGQRSCPLGMPSPSSSRAGHCCGVCARPGAPGCRGARRFQ
jgi:hypothetical protein